MIRKWSDGDVIALKFMWRVAGMSSGQIAKIMRRSRHSIIGKVCRLGMCEQGRWSPGGVARWRPFNNPKYRPDDDPDRKGVCQPKIVVTRKIYPLLGQDRKA